MKYKIIPEFSKREVFYIYDKDRYPVIVFHADGSFLVNDKPSTDVRELQKVLMAVVMEASADLGYVTRIESTCDCGGATAKTTCATWCSSHIKTSKS